MTYFSNQAHAISAIVWPPTRHSNAAEGPKVTLRLRSSAANSWVWRRALGLEEEDAQAVVLRSGDDGDGDVRNILGEMVADLVGIRMV
jgi:hypothetical protein